MKWEEKISVVKVNHSPRSLVMDQWNGVLSMFRGEVKYFKSLATTMQSKAIISKSKLLSKLNYICSVHVMPLPIRRSLNKILLEFVIPFSARNMLDEEIETKLIDFAAPKFLGGYGIDYITLHADLFLLKPVMKYIKYRAQNQELPKELFFVEYHIGMPISSFFGFRINNRTTHASQPCEVYLHIFDMICWMIEGFMIDINDIILGSVSAIYSKVISKLNERKSKLRYHRLLSNILPSYLQSFNYKLHNNLLPVVTLVREYALDNNSCCLFCSVGPESIWHMFGTCEKLQVVWKIASETVFCLTNKFFDFANSRKGLQLDLVNSNLGKDHKFEKFLIYFNTIIRGRQYRVIFRSHTLIQLAFLFLDVFCVH